MDSYAKTYVYDLLSIKQILYKMAAVTRPLLARQTQRRRQQQKGDTHGIGKCGDNP